MSINKRIFLLTFLQGLYPGTLGQFWIFPPTLQALSNSYIVIPCSVTGAFGANPHDVIWYLIDGEEYIEIFNSRDASRISPMYRGRTSLVSKEPGDCTLRIDNVRFKNDVWYYPGIHNRYNVYNPYEFCVKISVVDLPQEPGGQTWVFPGWMQALSGSCVVIPCSMANSASQDVIWYRFSQEIEIFNNRETSGIAAGYKGRTSLESTKSGHCSLRMEDVRLEDDAWYYPGKDDKNNAYNLRKSTIKLQVIDSPLQPVIHWTGNMTEGRPIVITCSVEHTCLSNPPRLQWNKPGEKGREYQTNFTDRFWRSISELVYTPSSQDHDSYIKCSAIHHRGKTSYNIAHLNIQSTGTKTDILVIYLPAIIGLTLILLIALMCWRCGKCKQCFACRIKGNETAQASGAPYVDLQKENVGRDYDKLKKKNDRQVPVTETKVDELCPYENA
uniref:Ig-like domain-containing protein n=1 Tax=Leptobrachium leishanense TaxID=445787 RepID=A0A8C5QM68_9ANUR